MSVRVGDEAGDYRFDRLRHDHLERSPENRHITFEHAPDLRGECSRRVYDAVRS